MESNFIKHKSRKGTPLYYSLVEGSEKPVVVMVHNMWGNHKSFRRHIELLNQNGYSCVTYNLFQGSSIHNDHDYTRWQYLNFMYRNWILQLTDVLDSIPAQKKIVFSFSGPSMAALIACSQRSDIVKYVCDGGPFENFWTCTYRMFTIEKPIKNSFKRALTTTLSHMYWGPFVTLRLHRALKKWNPKIPILSFRGQKDPIVYPQNIDNLFKKYPRVHVQAHELKEAHHLDGLKTCPEEYAAVLITFLEDETHSS